MQCKHFKIQSIHCRKKIQALHEYIHAHIQAIDLSDFTAKSGGLSQEFAKNLLRKLKFRQKLSFDLMVFLNALKELLATKFQNNRQRSDRRRGCLCFKAPPQFPEKKSSGSTQQFSNLWTLSLECKEHYGVFFQWILSTSKRNEVYIFHCTFTVLKNKLKTQVLVRIPEGICKIFSILTRNFTTLNC